MTDPNEKPPNPSRTIIIGLSGPSSSGKTTLARLLRQIFNVSVSMPTNTDTNPSSTSHLSIKLFILHQDDFYKTDKDIPLKHLPDSNRTLQDWDCIESIDLPLLSSTLTHIKTHGSLPPSLFSKEDTNSVGESGVPDTMVQTFHSEIATWAASLPSPRTSTSTSPDTPTNDTTNGNPNTTITICLLDGFLIYPDPTSPPTTQKGQMVTLMNTVLTTRLFIPSTRAQTITRRNARKGYVTLEGFWEDPEGYVEEIVWPNFGQDHAWLFGDGEKEEVSRRVDGGLVDRGVAREWGIEVGPGAGEVHLREVLPWAVGRVKGAVEGLVVDGELR